MSRYYRLALLVVAGLALTGCAQDHNFSTSPAPRHTVTVTASPQVLPTAPPVVTPPTVTVTVAPQACTDLARQVDKLYATWARYAANQAKLRPIQEQAYQAIIASDPTGLNNSRSELHRLIDATQDDLITVESLRTSIAELSATCQKGA